MEEKAFKQIIKEAIKTKPTARSLNLKIHTKGIKINKISIFSYTYDTSYAKQRPAKIEYNSSLL